MSEQYPKQWILRTSNVKTAEFRIPRPGEYYFGLQGLTVYKAPESPLIHCQCVILHHVPDDAVMVQRETLIAWKELGYSNHDDAALRIADSIADLLACAKPTDPMSMGVDALRLDEVIRLREKELKERGE